MTRAATQQVHEADLIGRILAMSAEELQQIIGYPLPESMLKLYQARESGNETAPQTEMRLMTFSEVAEIYQAFQDGTWGPLEVHSSMCPFWTDDNSNFAGLYVVGLLNGKVCCIDHEEVDLSPAYASVQSFQDAATTASVQDLGWQEFRRDYPAPEPADNLQTEAQDWRIVESLRPLYAVSQDRLRVHYAYCIMVLTPYAQTVSLLDYTYDRNMHIQAEACEILGLRRYKAATNRLAEVARNGMQNGRIASVLALGKIGSLESRRFLEELLPTMPEGYGSYIKRALEKAG